MRWRMIVAWPRWRAPRLLSVAFIAASISAVALASCGSPEPEEAELGERIDASSAIAPEREDAEANPLDAGAGDSAPPSSLVVVPGSADADDPSTSSDAEAAAPETSDPASTTESTTLETRQATSAPTTQTSTNETPTTKSATTQPATTQPPATRPATTAPATTQQATTAPATTPPTSAEPTTTDQTAAPRPSAGTFLTVDFQRSTVGAYGDDQVRADWNNVRYSITDGRTAIREQGSNRFLRVTYPTGQVGPNQGGAQWLIGLGSNAGDELYASYRVRFSADFNPVRGGKLPGLSGGENNTGGDKPNGNDGWSARIMWRRDNNAVQYLYHPDQPTTYGEDLDWGRTFPKGEWITVETRIKMNTPGQRNGVVQSWMNGQQVLSRTDIRFRDVDTFAIDGFMFSTFFGGSGAEWAPTKNEYIDFDDFQISGSPISH